MRPFWPASSVVLFLLAACLWIYAEHPDPCYLSARTAPVVQKSTFVHGYLHGYAEGYSTADIDLQMARAPRDPSKIKEARNSTGYRASFGSRKFFDSGYQEGFRVGYADSLAGRAFRAVDQLQQVMRMQPEVAAAADPPSAAIPPPKPVVPHASALLNEQPAPAAPQPPSAARTISFDEGFSRGYASGRFQGLADARRDAAATSTPVCTPELAGRSASTAEFCTAYVRGYTFGYSDGYVNVSRRPTVATGSQASSK